MAPDTAWPLVSSDRPRRWTCSWSRPGWQARRPLTLPGGPRLLDMHRSRGRPERAGRRRMLGLADALGALPPAALEMTAARVAARPLHRADYRARSWHRCHGRLRRGREAGIPPEALVMEMYMSGEMESVFRSFRETGFLRASEDHGPTAIFGGLTRALEIDREEIATRFRRVLEDIKSGAFADDSRRRPPWLPDAGHRPDMFRGLAYQRRRDSAPARRGPPGSPSRSGVNRSRPGGDSSIDAAGSFSSCPCCPRASPSG